MDPGSAFAHSGRVPLVGHSVPAPFICAVGRSGWPHAMPSTTVPAVTLATSPHVGQAPAAPWKEYKQPQKQATSAIIGTFFASVP
jgi:hypothetical protein